MASKGNIQQIVKVLIGDTAVLQPGRKTKKRKPTFGSARSATKRVTTKRPKRERPKGVGKPPPPGPKGPEGFLSQVFGPPRPPQPFIQPIQPQSYFSPQTKTLEQQLLEAIKKAQTTAQAPTPQAPTPQAPTPQAPTPQGPKLEAIVVPAQKTISRAPTVILPSPEGVFATPMTGSSIPATASRVYSSASANIPQAASRTLSDRLISESQAAIERAQSLRRALSQGPQPASNQANQPSVDVDGDGKEAEELQPQQPAVTFVQPPPPIAVYSGAAQASSSSSSSSDVFASSPVAPSPPAEEEISFVIEEDSEDSEDEVDPPGSKQWRAQKRQELAKVNKEYESLFEFDANKGEDVAKRGKKKRIKELEAIIQGLTYDIENPPAKKDRKPKELSEIQKAAAAQAAQKKAAAEERKKLRSKFKGI